MIRKDTLRTRQKIIKTAEQLFAQKGVDGVSLNEITRAAGQKNKSALSYHFGNKDSLLLAIIERHEAHVIEQRNAYLDDLEQRKAVTIESVVRAFVYPLATKLDDEDGGKDYLRILSQLTACPTMPLFKLRPDFIAPDDRIMKLFVELNPEIPEELLMPRLLQVSNLLFHGLSYLAGIITTRDESRRLCQVFIEDLVDSIIAITTALPSNTTQRMLLEAC